MSPIPANASAAMMFSFFVAVMVDALADAEVSPARRCGRSAWRRTRRAARSAALYRRGRAPDPRHASARAWMFLIVVGVADAGVAGAVLHQARHGQAAALRQQVGAAGRRRPARRRVASRPPTRSLQAVARHRSRDCPRSRSVQTYAGTAAPFNFNGLVRHYYLRAVPRAGRRRRSTSPPKGERERASHDIALDMRQRLAGRRRAARAPASRSSSRRPARRCWRRCWPRSTARTPRPAAPSPPRCAKAFRSVPFIVDVDDSLRRSRAPRLRHRRSTRTISNSYGVEQRDVYDTHRSPVRRRDRRLFAPRRRPPADPDPARARRRATASLDERCADDAGPGQRAARRPRPWSSSATSCSVGSEPPPSRSSATTAAPPRW